jgi:hypothetical protein
MCEGEGLNSRGSEKGSGANFCDHVNRFSVSVSWGKFSVFPDFSNRNNTTQLKIKISNNGFGSLCSMLNWLMCSILYVVTQCMNEHEDRRQYNEFRGLWVEGPVREADHSPPFSAEIKNDGAVPPLPHTSWYCSNKLGDNFHSFIRYHTAFSLCLGRFFEFHNPLHSR